MPAKQISLDEPIEIIRFGEPYRVMLMPKLSRGIEFIDLRMWVRWTQDGKLHPGKNGIMMERAKFRVAINRIKELLDVEAAAAEKT